MKRHLIAAATAIAAVALGATAALAQPATVTIATEGAYEPWNFTGPDGTIQGFEVDLANDLCARMKVECKIVAQDWDGLIPALTAKKYDAIMASMIVTEKRLKVIAFSEPYAPTSAGILAEKAGPLGDLPGTGTTVDLGGDPAAVEAALAPLKTALAGKLVGAQVSTANAGFVDTYLAGVVEKREYKTVEQHDLDMLAGRLDAIVEQTTAIGNTLSKPDFAAYAQVGPTFVGGVFGKGIAVGLRQDDTELKAKFDAAIAAAKADGTVERLAKQWLKVSFQ